MSDRSRAAHELKPRIPRTARADKALETQRRLIDAAAKVVGAEGYANASVAKITALAEVAQGTFYNYFGSQQDLFDHLLPELGGQMLEFIRERVAGVDDSFAREQAGFLAFFEFLEARPEFYRILNEAETFSPTAFHAHMRNMAEGYLRALGRSHAKGELPGFDERELEVIVYTLLAARNYIAYRFVAARGEGRPRQLPPWVAEAYMKLVTGGMRFGGTGRRPARLRTRASGGGAMRQADPTFRIRSQSSGYAEVERVASQAACDGGGGVRTADLTALMETAGALAVTGGPDAGAARLQSFTVSLMAPPRAARLVASARLEGGGGDRRHVTIRVSDAARREEALVMAQAVYAVRADWDEERAP